MGAALSYSAAYPMYPLFRLGDSIRLLSRDCDRPNLVGLSCHLLLYSDVIEHFRMLDHIGRTGGLPA